MTNSELLQAIKNGRDDTEIVEAVTDFVYDFDTYGCWDAYGRIEEDGVRDQIREEAIFLLHEERDELISMLEA